MNMLIRFKIEVIVEPDDGQFYAYVPELKGLHVYGDSVEEALENVRTAATLHLTSLLKHGDPVPVGMIRRVGIPKWTIAWRALLRALKPNGRTVRVEELCVGQA